MNIFKRAGRIIQRLWDIIRNKKKDKTDKGFSYPENIAPVVYLDDDANKAKIGIDYILGYKYPEIIIENHPAGFAAGFLLEISDLSGDSLKVIEDIIQTGKAPIIRVHLIWRDNHKFGPAETELAIKRCKKIAPLIKKYQEVQWYLNPWLEPITYGKARYFDTINKCREVLKGTNVRMASNAIPTHEYPATYTEMHHKDYTSSPQLQIFSFDGEQANKKNITKYKNLAQKAELFFLWSWRLNGKSGKSDPRKRPDRIHWADAGEIQRLVELVQ